MLLDCLMTVACVAALLSGLYFIDVAPLWTFAAQLPAVLACALLWIPLRRSATRSGPRRRAAAAAFAVCATAAWFLANGTLGFGMLWMAAVVLARAFGGAVIAGYSVLVVGIGSAVHVFIGTPPAQIVVEAVGAATFVLIGALIAVLLHASETAERELHAVNAELRERGAVEQELVLAQERARTAQALHDGLGHRLTAIGLSLEFADRVRDPGSERAWAEVAEAKRMAADALRDMRRLVRAMHPMDVLGLEGADRFSGIARAFRSSGIEIDVLAQGPLDAVPQQQMLLLVRFVQEGLTNVVRHSDAERVAIRIEALPGAVTACLSDDGAQAESDPARVIEGFGLRSLRERSEELGGSFSAARTPGGFDVRMVLPMRGAGAVEASR